MDFMMGAAGLNTIATLLVAFVRPGLLRVLYRREDLRDGGIPSPDRLGRGVFLDYLVILILLHHTVFFALESLSWVHALRTALRIVTSSAVTVFFTWAFARILPPNSLPGHEWFVGRIRPDADFAVRGACGFSGDRRAAGVAATLRFAL